MKNIIVSIAIWFTVILILTGCSQSKKNITKLDDVKNSSIGAMTGTTGEQLARERFPDASIKSFDDIMDAVAALKSNQLDAVIAGFPTAMNVCKHNPDLQYLSEAVNYENTEVAVKKGNQKLLAEVNKIINDLKNDGTLKDMRRRWFKTDLSPYEKVEIPLPKNGEILKIGTSATREPFCFVDANRKVTGHDGELARRIGAKLGRPIEFVDMKFSALIPSLQSGKVDLIIAGITGTAERKKSVDFSETYFKSSQVLIVKKAIDEEPAAENKTVKLRTIDDVANKIVGVYAGSVHDAFVQKKYPKAEIKRFHAAADMIFALKMKKIDVAFYDLCSTNVLLKSNPEVGILTKDALDLPVGYGFHKNNPALREKFNKFLQMAKSDGTYDTVYKRWFVDDPEKAHMPKIEFDIHAPEIILGVTVGDWPNAVIVNGELVGFDVELLKTFAKREGYSMKIIMMEFPSLIAALVSGKVDIIADGICITEERQKQVDFSEPYNIMKTAVIALRENISIVDSKKMSALDDIADKRVGVYEGTVHDAFVASKYPKASISRYNSSADMDLSLKTGKIDIAMLDLISAKLLLKNNPELGILTEDALTLPLGIGFRKENHELRRQFNEFLALSKSNGSYNEIYKRWCIDDAENAKMPQHKFSENSPVLKVAVAVEDLPYVAYLNGEYVGIDIELIQKFAEHKGYRLKLIQMEFPSLIAALASGKVDMIADGIAITEERKKKVGFSDSYMNFRTAVIALKENLAAYEHTKVNGGEFGEESSPIFSFFNEIAESFHSNIIVENRYMLIINGLKTTAIISVLSILFGTLLGGLICFMRMSRKKILLLFGKVYISILRGTPVLVLLMIIFYVVFASIDIDPVIVAVIAFGLNFAAYVSEMYRTGIEGVDKGQTEAGIAMGFTKIATFIYIIFPQAARRILPVYKGEVISLVKMTSIVGYIAVQDLTKASDIIRSRTFDAFFPLIMVAVLYFLISWLLMLLLGYVERITNPKLKMERV